MFVVKNNRPLQRIHFHPRNNVTSQSFEQLCINAENDLSVIHDVCENDIARDCVISLKHLRVCN